MCFVSMDSNLAKLLGRYISKFYDSDIHTWTPPVIVEQIFFEEKFIFHFVRVEVNAYYCHTNDWKGLKFFVKMTCCIAMWIWKSTLTFGAEILFESFFFFANLNSKASTVCCKAIVFMQSFVKCLLVLIMF